ncbi:aminoacyl-tRNA deacylase [Gracilimonas mengyeensis]|uniref:Ala-tRNA(Pro) deacylase n=1 Tax=Gracilimonas mengyeensis TaxID=1302730 RepID=A0A521D5I1_9BACT|nr:YbaK/EbsC family protein [Gracilimonas mengyeensis]SMO66927.1 Ala-tRNA(Pro) deacylase [Gracilimonas mengyeensis]
MPLNRLIDYLDQHDKKYVVIKHSKAFTAQEVAASAHIPGKEMAKTVIVKVDGDFKMVVLPSTHDVEFEAIKDALNAETVKLATEDEFESMFPDCEVGAMPPFGNLYDMDTLVSEALAEDKEIAFNAGTHKELVKMSYADFEELEKPKVFPLGVKTA